jgi:predicted transcriptional regulator
MKKERLNEIIRNKIAVEISMNPKKSHADIAGFYGVSRQLVTKVAKEYSLQRTGTKNINGAYTYPARKTADIAAINKKYSDVDDRFISTSDILVMEMINA